MGNLRIDKSGYIPIMRFMDPIVDFVARCDALAAKRGIRRSTLSTYLFRDGKRLEQLARGDSDVGVLRLEQAKQALSALEAAAQPSLA